MKFLLKLRNHLKQHKIIYTVRKYRYFTNKIYVIDIGLCNRSLVKSIYCKEELSDYVLDSGFKSIEAWWDVIQSFMIHNESMFLYKIEVGECNEVFSNSTN